MIVQYLNEETDIGTMCVCNSMSFYHICRFLQLSHNQDPSIFHHHKDFPHATPASLNLGRSKTKDFILQQSSTELRFIFDGERKYSWYVFKDKKNISLKFSGSLCNGITIIFFVCIFKLLLFSMWL